MSGSCKLCHTSLPRKPYLRGEHSFCCPGCHTVHQVLEAKGALDGAKDHPIFMQALQSGIISNPDLLDAMNHEEVDEKHKLYLEINQMWCPSCAEVIRLLLMREKGVLSCRVDYLTDLAVIEYDPKTIGKKRIVSKISSWGYEPNFLESEEEKQSGNTLGLRLVVASFCAVNLMMFAYGIYASEWTADRGGYTHLLANLSFFFSLPVITYASWPIFIRSWFGLKAGFVGMEALVSMSVLSAFFLSVWNVYQGSDQIYLDSMSVVVAFVLLGRLMESRAKFSAKNTLFRITRSLPRKARKRFGDGTEEFVPIKEIQPGDTYVVVAGERIVLEGKVQKGTGGVDQSLLTGESVPVLKKEGDEVLGGTILQSGHLVIQALGSLEQTLLYQMIHTMEGQLSEKVKTARPVDRIAAYVAPVALFIGLFSGVIAGSYDGFDAGVIRAMAVFLIACPCAIGIAAPIAESKLLHQLAEKGIVIRNRAVLSLIGRETCFAMDKTGTVTEGKFEVLSGLEPLSQPHLKLLKSIAVQSNHPISVAINAAISEPILELKEIFEHPGQGVEGWINGTHIQIGSASYLGVDRPSDLTSTLCYVSIDGQIETVISLGDQIKSGSRALVQSLSDCKTLLLSGDRELVVKQISADCGFDDYLANQTPWEKREAIEDQRRKGETIAMLGDGLNDAAALAAADIGISVASATDLSVQVSDVLLTHDRFEVIPEMRSECRFGQRILKQNLFWAFSYNGIGLVLAATGFLIPIFSALAMVLSSGFVLLNAGRLSLKTTPKSLFRSRLRAWRQKRFETLQQDIGE